ncbi:Serine/threonineprotein kinase pellelike [Caligus rogercresseyi]|uniref:Serine/threonineprotein kinase pellelike n=1 Tax=Caligus rogercresseyi TaxID=217165 RepID=A0A7T8KDB9_CALRO|nr:Serine/threonineprotein kinase pellelike [Caligus rogercresseyi]
MPSATEMKQVFEALKKLSEFNSPPNYDSNIYHPDVVSSVTNFTNHMSECLSGNHIGDNIPLVLLSNTSSNGPPTPTMGDPSSFSEEDDPFSSSQDMSSRQTTTRDFIEEPNVKSEEFNIPNLSFLRNDEEPPPFLPWTTAFQISALKAEYPCPAHRAQTPLEQNLPFLKKLKQMDNMDNSPCSSKLANIQRSIDSCTNVDDIL